MVMLTLLVVASDAAMLLLTEVKLCNDAAFLPSWLTKLALASGVGGGAAAAGTAAGLSHGRA